MSDSGKFWDRWAARYSKSQISDENTYQKKLTETQRLFNPDMRVVEFGCGTGMTAVHHAPHVAHIDAIDVSSNMLDIGRKRVDDANVENISFVHGTLIEFAALPNSVDVVLGMSILHLLPNRENTIAEVAKILKPGGSFVSSTACMGNSYLRFIKLISPLAKLLGLMPDFFVFTESELAQEITQSGFTIEQQWHHGTSNMTVFIIATKLP